MTVESADIGTVPSLTFDLPPALATPPGAGAVCDDQGARKIGRGAAEGLFTGGDVIVAHAGLIRRFLRAPDHDTSVLVGDVGLVAVHPGRQGQGLGAALMSSLATALSTSSACGAGLPAARRTVISWRNRVWRSLRISSTETK